MCRHPRNYSLEGAISMFRAKYLRFLIDQYFVSPDIDSLNAGIFAVAANNAKYLPASEPVKSRRRGWAQTSGSIT